MLVRGIGCHCLTLMCLTVQVPGVDIAGYDRIAQGVREGRRVSLVIDTMRKTTKVTFRTRILFRMRN